MVVMSSPRVVCLLLVLGCGCVFDRSGLSWWTTDGSDRDGQAVDRWSNPDQPHAPVVNGQPVPVDGQPVDGQPVDQQPVDQQPVDQVPVDVPPQPCATKYGSVNGFVLCSETATQCVFYFLGWAVLLLSLRPQRNRKRWIMSASAVGARMSHVSWHARFAASGGG